MVRQKTSMFKWGELLRSASCLKTSILGMVAAGHGMLIQNGLEERLSFFTTETGQYSGNGLQPSESDAGGGEELEVVTVKCPAQCVSCFSTMVFMLDMTIVDKNGDISEKHLDGEVKRTAAIIRRLATLAGWVELGDGVVCPACHSCWGGSHPLN